MGEAKGTHRWLLASLVAVAAFVTYLPSLANGYAEDDIIFVEGDARLRTWESLPELAFERYHTESTAERSVYRPVTTLSYFASWQLGRGHPFAFHLLNVLAHVAATLLLMSILVRLGIGVTVASLASLVFAVHPVHVEAVANVVGRADILMTLFCLLGVRLWLAGSVPIWARIGGVSLAYLFAVGAKENGYVLPILILLMELIRPQAQDDPSAGVPAGDPRSKVRALAARACRCGPLLAAMALVLASYLIVRTAVLGAVVQLDVAAYIAVLPEALRRTTGVANLSEAARLLVFPSDLSAYYVPAVLNPAGLGDLRFWSGVALCIGCGALIAVTRRRRPAGPWVLLAFGWIAASYLLLTNLVVPLPMWIAERTLYLPSVGVSLLMVAVLEQVRLHRGSRSLRALGGTIVILSALGAWHSWQYSKVWRSSDALYADHVERHPESFRAQWWTGRKLVEAGDIEGGLVWLGRAVELNPNGVRVTLEYTRALLLVQRSGEAEALMRPISRRLHPSVSVYLAQSLIFQDRLPEALRVVAIGLESFPTDERLIEQQRLLDEGR